MESVVAKRHESPAERLIPFQRLLINRIKNQRIDTDDPRGFFGLAKRAKQHKPSEPLALRRFVNSQASQQHYANRPGGQIARADDLAFDYACDQRIVSEDLRRSQFRYNYVGYAKIPIRILTYLTMQEIVEQRMA